ncbi:hypothetical protein RD792_017114 [Penstemon davidsonii]|uniref:Bidirectional sugar transporter SWEET n=1 Tax=Penstemon davidsonii TaxID=160366 RepID=A0ABR0CMW8_9LAMI|nr:hypothetical protein RD792_017114 [Penstemon davidsonii]
MALSALSIFFGVLGNITAALLFLSPVPTFWRILKNRSTEEFESVPYIILFLNASLWTYYGLITPNGFLLVTINGFGATVQAIYILIFLIFATTRMKVKTAILVVVLDVGVVVGAILITRLTMGLEAQIDTIGLMCTCVTIISFASPLAAMKTVILTKSVEYMPFLLSFFYFLTAFSWTVYAILVRDLFIGVSFFIIFLMQKLKSWQFCWTKS